MIKYSIPNPQSPIPSDNLKIGDRQFTSRLLVGTGKYKNFEETAEVIKKSGAEIVTVAVRRVNITTKGEPSLQDWLDPNKYTYLPNSAGCNTAKEAVRFLKLAREAGGWKLVKLEVIAANHATLYPDVEETLQAAKELVADGFEVMAYTSDDPITARKLQDIGCVAVMPLGAPIGSGLGIQNRLNIEMIIKQASVPIIVDAGVGTASDASIAMEMGCDGVLMNTAISDAKNPALMAEAMKNAVIAGRQAFLAGRMPKKGYGTPSSPTEGMIE